MVPGTPTMFTGLLQGEELSRAFAAADVFVMPSDSETLGFVVLESMASGVPVVGCNRGGIPSLIDDGKTGYLFEPGDTDELAARARSLVDVPPQKRHTCVKKKKNMSRCAAWSTTRQRRERWRPPRAPRQRGGAGRLRRRGCAKSSTSRRRATTASGRGMCARCGRRSSATATRCFAAPAPTCLRSLATAPRSERRRSSRRRSGSWRGTSRR
mmetsp:Transcript_12578/g.40112  ORF Transcript_12578/g.40112 Transcript_12578/m.40112 type:complete len:212 (+) Transcript_12578:1155-1790(+)